jgi:hypothetical protein
MTEPLKIAVFGDSYADEFKHIKDTEYGTLSLPWVRELKKISNHSITNFAISGSSFYYSAKLFFENYKKFDKIVFVVTYPGRMHINNPDVDENLSHIAGLDHLFWKVEQYEMMLKNESLSLTKEKLDKAMPYLNALRGYYLYLYDYEQIEMFHFALYEKINNMLPHDKLLLMPVITLAAPNFQDTTLGDISQIDNRPKNYRTEDYRPNHINSNNRRMLAEKINEWINNGVFNLTPDDIRINSEPFDEMFPRMANPVDFGRN